MTRRWLKLRLAYAECVVALARALAAFTQRHPGWLGAIARRGADGLLGHVGQRVARIRADVHRARSP